MNLIPTSSGTPVPTMSSLQIAALVNSRHDNVKASIERLAERGVITLPALQEVPNTGPGPATIKAYCVTERDSYVVVAQLSPEFTAKLVDEWAAMKATLAAQVPALPKTFGEALQLAATQALALEKQALELAEAAPKVAFHDAYRVAPHGAINNRDMAALLGTTQTEFINWMLDQGIYYRASPSPSAKTAGKVGPLRPYAVYMGYFAKTLDVVRPGEDNARQITQFRINGAGVVWITTLWSNRNAVTKV